MNVICCSLQPKIRTLVKHPMVTDLHFTEMPHSNYQLLRTWCCKKRLNFHCSIVKTEYLQSDVVRMLVDLFIIAPNFCCDGRASVHVMHVRHQKLYVIKKNFRKYGGESVSTPTFNNTCTLKPSLEHALYCFKTQKIFKQKFEAQK